jgi:hypothetical protein
MSMKKLNDTIGNQTRDLPACSAVPQPTAPPRAPAYVNSLFLFSLLNKLPANMKDKGPLQHLPTETTLGHSIQFIFPQRESPFSFNMYL